MQAKILVVSKTRMKRSHVCVGAITDTALSLRLLTEDGENQPDDTPFEVGSIWDIEYSPQDSPEPPHVEDVHVSYHRLRGKVGDIIKAIRSNVDVFDCPASELFDGCLHFPATGKAYVNSECIPPFSTCFWIAPVQATYIVEGNKNRYVLSHSNHTLNLPLVGLQKPVTTLASGTLLRLSLARWFDCIVSLLQWQLSVQLFEGEEP